MKDTDQLCEFPPGKSESITVAFQDYKSLEYETFITDHIVDFFVSYLSDNILSKREAVHCFSWMFYRRLSETRSDINSNSAWSKHQRVRKWTKNVNIFKKTHLVLPIVENKHWYAVIVVNPVLGKPFFVVLDRLNITTGKMSPAITPYHFFWNFDSFNFHHR